MVSLFKTEILDDYSNLIIKDSGDVNPENFPGCKSVKTYRKIEYDPDEIKIMSVKTTRIGKETIKKHNQLEYIISRSHGLDHIDVSECNRRGITVIPMSPFTVPCAEWIRDKLDSSEKNVVIFGNGPISKHFQTLVPCVVFDSKVTKQRAIELINGMKDVTIISTIPLNNNTKHYFNDEFFKNIQTSIKSMISISRGELILNSALCKYLEFHDTKCHLDSVTKDDFYQQINSKCSIYNHTAWKFMSVKYDYMLKDIVDKCLKDLRETHQY